VPPFTLTERSGNPLRASDLAGHVWVADFVFTHCPDFCPLLTTRMRGLQDRLGQSADPVRLVSFSVDPVRDTPEVLRDYATRIGAGPSWFFVTGSPADLARVLRDGFRVAWADNGPAAQPITHSDRFVLVDRQLRIRGYYHGTDQQELERLARDTVGLQAERTP
jgi:protein SCO1